MIHPSALIDPKANIAEDVEIGAYSLIQGNVTIGSGCKINSHVVIKGPTKIGNENHIFQFASVGEDCQDKKYKGEHTWLEIGNKNVIREYCTLHRGTSQDKGVTKIGNGNLFMGNVHIAHDCVVGDNCIFANNVALAGHVIVNDNVILGGYTGVHQFCTISSFSMSAVHSSILKDVPAYVMVSGNPARPRGMNFEGMRRRGWSQKTISELKKAYNLLYKRGLLLEDAVSELHKMVNSTPEVKLLIYSIKLSKRGLVR